MVEKGEEQHDLGGYFIVKGNERLLRLLIMPRRNYVSVHNN
jgi:DNA-directed RNA polymerase I subunit RPA2